MYPQSKTERLLLGCLTQSSCRVYWDTTLTALQQKPEGVQVQIKNKEGEYQLLCDWVVGADGAHSTVRKQLQIPFNGDTYAHYFYLVDAKLKNAALEANYINLFLDKNNFAGFFPLPGQDSYRIIGNLPHDPDNKNEPTTEEILPCLDQATRSTTKIVTNNWFTTYKLHHRIADKFRDERCFLIGDAAHIHSPVGGQGMNTGLQDAYNLAWKLAGVIKGQIKPAVLDSYAAERMPVAKDLLRTTDRVFNFIISSNFIVAILKKYALFKILNAAWKSEKIKGTFFERVSQINITYRHSRINLHLSRSTSIKAGDRLPYIKLFDEKKGEETDLHAWCSKPGFTLIILGKFDELFLFTMAKWIANSYPAILNFFYLPPSGKNLAVFEAFETDPHQQKAIIVRPDMYIGYLNDVADIAMMNNYLKNVAGVNSAS